MPTLLREAQSLLESERHFRSGSVIMHSFPIYPFSYDHVQIITERIHITSTTISPSHFSTSPSPFNAPSYQLGVSYVRSTNGGKSLLAKGRTKASKSYSFFFDEQGNMNQDAFERWVGELVEQGMDGKSAWFRRSCLCFLVDHVWTFFFRAISLHKCAGLRYLCIVLVLPLDPSWFVVAANWWRNTSAVCMIVFCPHHSIQYKSITRRDERVTDCALHDQAILQSRKWPFIKTRI